MTKGAMRIIKRRMMILGAFIPWWSRRHHIDLLLGEYRAEIRRKEKTEGRDLSLAEIRAYLYARPRFIQQARDFWPQWSHLPPEILPACSGSIEYCLFGFFLPELLILGIAASTFYAMFGEFPEQRVLHALQALTVITLATLAGLLAMSVIFPILESIRSWRMKIF